MKKNLKRTLSLILSVAMVFTLIPLGTVWASAADDKASSTICGDLKFYVPEAIYLYPNGSSDIDSTATNFQWYINNNSDGTVKSGYDTTGSIYYSYAKATNTSLSYRFVDRYLNSALSGGSVSLSTTSPGTSATINITGGTSPSLKKDEYGCYIEWTLSFTDSTDSQAKKAYAYTYVYKPYIIPVGGFNKMNNTDGSDHYCQSVTWMTGVHSITVGTMHDDGGYYPKRNSEYGLGGFITKGTTAYIGSTSYTAGLGSRQSDCWNAATRYTGADKWNLAFINTGSSASSYIKTNPGNKGATNYGKTGADGNTYGVRSMDYWYKEKSAYNVLSALYSSARGNIYIDTSRYDDLSQIPNLGIATMLCDNQGSEWGNWYIADASGVSLYRVTESRDGADSCREVWDGKNYIIAGVGTSATNDSSTDSWDEEGVQYAGPWPRTTLGSTGTQGATYTYSFRSWHTEEEDSTGTNDWAYNTCLVDLLATYYNKANLRAAVNNAIKKMPALGVNAESTGIGKPTSCYFDANTSYKWTAFQDAFQKAVRVLGSVDMATGISDNPNTLATNLNNALDALCTKVTLDANGGSGTKDYYVTIGTNQKVSVTPSSISGYSAPTRTGYTLQGWSTSSTGTAASSETVGYNNTLYAIWKINTSTLKVNPNGGTWNGFTSEQSYTQNYNTTKSIPVPTRTGYTFSGWTRSGTNGSMSSTTAAATYTFGPANAATDTITASWTINKYYLDLNWDYTDGNGTANVGNAKDSGYASADVYAPNTTLVSSGAGDFYTQYNYQTTWKMVATVTDASKYIFKNGSTYATTETRSGTLGASNHGETFHIMPVYNIAFNANNGSGSMSNIEKIPYDRTQTLTSNSFIRTGYTFAGWNTAANGTGTPYSDGASVSKLTSTAGGTVTLYAQWTNDTFYLAYNGNKPSTTSNTVGNIPGNTTLTYNTAAYLGSAPTLTGYIFGGWYEDSANDYKIGDAGAEIRASKVNEFYDLVGKGETKTAYAKWTPITYTVVYNGNTNTSGSMSDSSHTYDVAKNLTANAFLKTGYSFQGWATTAGGNVAYGNSASVKNLTSTNGATVTLYAKWNPNTITLNFNGNGSTSGSVNNQVFTYDTAQTLNENKFAKAYTVKFVYNGADGGEMPATLPATFSFDGWNSATDGKGSYNYADKQSVTNPCGVSDPNGSATIYAKWTGGEITLPVPTRFGYSFVGWFKNADCSGNDFKAGGTGYTPANNNETFYAKWTPNDLTVKYSAGGVAGISVPADQKFKYDGTVTTAAPLTKNFTVTYDYNGVTGSDIVTEATPSCAWTGWYCVNCDKKFAANTTYEGKDFGVNAGDIFLTANWSTAEITLPSPTRPGYTFDGWYEDEDPFKTLAGKGGDKYIHDSDITLHAKWTPHTFTVTYDANGMNPDAGTMPTVSVPNGKLTYDTAYSKSSNGLISALIPKNDTRVFVGWNSKADGTGTSFYPNTECTAEVTDALYVAAGNKNGGLLTLYAIWEDISDIDDKSEEIKKIDGKDVVEYGLENEEYPVFKGLKYENGEWVEQYEEEALTKYSDATAYTTYQTDADAYYQAKNTVLNTVTKNTADDFVEKLNNLRESVTTVEGKVRDIYTKYFTDGFEITYPGEATKTCKASGMNLNHYTSAVLNSAVTALTNGRKLLSNKITSQLDLNACVKALANAFVSKAGRETAKPTYKVFETSGGIKSITGENIDAVNYVYTGKGNYTYYCYTNSTTPTIDVLVDETGSTTSYPTRSTVTSTTNSHFDATTKKIGTLSQAFSDYISAGVGGDYQGEINGETYTGSDYYTRQSFVKLNPTLTNARQEAVYQIASTDDSFNENVADTATLYGKNKAATDIQELSGNNTAVTPEGTITVVICYKGQDGFDVTGSQVNMDAWLSQYHLTRTSGGANTWEYIKENDSVYTIDDPTYGQLGNASFTYTFVPGKNIASADLTTVIDYIKNHYADIKKETFTGTNAGGEGLGYKVWNITASNSWSFNYYPKAGSFTYVHLVDRWGNVVDKVIPVPQCLDSKAPKVSTASSGADFIIEEEGGSGIQTMSVNAKSFDIIADESTVLEGKTYSSADGTVRVYTGEANKSYTLNCTDAAGNSLKTTVKSDADGYLTISVEDKEYSFDGGAYTFTLNGYEINLYDGVFKKIKKVEDATVTVGTAAVVHVVTDDNAYMVQMVDKNGNTKSTGVSTTYEDGKKTWTFTRTLGEGVYDYKIRVKMTDGKWYDEEQTSTITVTEKTPSPKEIGITDVKYEQSAVKNNTFTFDATGSPRWIQVVNATGGTRTYGRTNENVISIEESNNGETWKISIALSEGTYTVKAKYGNEWQASEPYEFTVKLLEKPEPSEVKAVYSYELDNADAITCGKHTVTVVTDKSVSKVQLMSSSGSTTTYTASNAVIEVVDGKKIWTFEKNFTVLGSYSYKIMTRTSSTKFADSGVSIDVTVLS